MDYEKLHKETLAGLQRMVRQGRITVEEAVGICSDFVVEGEDERVRKMLIEQMEHWHECALENNVTQDIKDSADAISWLEKRKEQKPVISDEAIRDGVAHFGITQYQIDHWLKKYINVVKQQPTEWSEEDERIMNNCIEYIKASCLDANDLYECIEWLMILKSYRHD